MVEPTSKKRKAPIADSNKKPPKKKAKTKAIVDSPAPQRNRRPPQRNASPGPSIQKSSASVASSRKRVRSPDPVDSDWSPPPVSSLKSGRVPKPTAKSLANTLSKAPASSKKSQKTASVRRQKTPAIATSEVIELSSSEDDEIEPSPISNRKRPWTGLPIPRRAPPIMATVDVIDLCSDVDERPRPVNSSPVRTKLENNVTVILSSDDEIPQPDSEPKPRRPVRLKKPTLKARALLNFAKASRDDETQAPSRPPEKGRVGNKHKRSRPSTAASPLSDEAADSPQSPSDITEPTDEIDNPTPYAGDEDAVYEEETELQQAIYDSLVQDPPAFDEDDNAPENELTEDDKQVGVAQDRETMQEDSQSLQGGPNTKTVPPSESPTPAPTLPPLSTSPNVPFSELHGSLVHDESEPESHSVSDAPHTENEDPALQDAILLSLIWTEGSMENELVNSATLTGSCSGEQPPVSASDPIVTLPAEPQVQDATLASDHESHVEDTTIAGIAHDITISSFHSESENEDKGMQDPLFASFSQEQGSNSNSTDLEGRSPDIGDHENEDMEIQDVLFASFSQSDTVLATDLPVIPAVASTSGAMQPITYSQTVDLDDTSTYLPPHLSYAPPPLPDIYGYGHHEDGHPGAMPGFVQDAAAGEEGGAEGGGEISALGTGMPAVKNVESRRNEHDGETVPGEGQFGNKEENEDMPMQRVLLRSFALNEGTSEEAGGNKDREDQDTTEEHSNDSHPIPTNTDPDLYFPALAPTSESNDLAEDVVSEPSKSSAKQTLSQLEPSTSRSTPDRSSSSRNGLSSPSKYISPSHTARKPNLSITYSSAPLATFPRLLTPGFFAQSFLPPIYQTLKAVSSPAVVEAPATTQSEPQSSRTTQRSSSPAPVMQYTSPQCDEKEDSPEMKESSEITQASLHLETSPQPEAPLSVTAQPSSVIFEEYPSEETEEAEVDLELTRTESVENDAVLTAAFTEAKADAHGHATGSAADDPSPSPEHGYPNAEQPKAEDESSPTSGLAGSGIQQSEAENGEGDQEHSRCPNSEQPKHPGKSLSESSLDSLPTVEDSPAPTTPVQFGYFDPSTFFIRSSSPVDFNPDILKDFMHISVPPPLDKDDDAYLLSTHSFDYPDEVDVIG